MKKRILSILLLCCMVLTLLPTTVLAADGPDGYHTKKYDVSIDVYNRTSDISIKDSRSYYIYSSVPDNLRDTWAWDKKIFIKGDKTAPHVFIDGVNIEMSPSSKGPAIELNKKASAYIYFIGKNSSLQGADGRAAIQKKPQRGSALCSGAHRHHGDLQGRRQSGGHRRKLRDPQYFQRLLQRRYVRPRREYALRLSEQS